MPAIDKKEGVKKEVAKKVTARKNKAPREGNFKVQGYEFYNGMRARLAENDSYAARFAIVEYRDHPENGNAFQLCVGTYICGDKSIRKTMEEELKGSRVLQVARDLVTKNERKNKTNEVAETGFIAKLKRNRLLQRPPETRLSGKSP